jgi:hypothetical protein
MNEIGRKRVEVGWKVFAGSMLLVIGTATTYIGSKAVPAFEAWGRIPQTEKRVDKLEIRTDRLEIVNTKYSRDRFADSIANSIQMERIEDKFCIIINSMQEINRKLDMPPVYVPLHYGGRIDLVGGEVR